MMSLSHIVNTVKLLNALSGQPDTTVLEQKYVQDIATAAAVQFYEKKDTTRAQLDSFNALYAKKLQEDAHKDAQENHALKHGFVPTNISMEGSITQSPDANGSGVQDTKITFNNGTFIRYVAQHDIKTGKEQGDVLTMFGPEFSVAGITLGAGYLKTGDWNERDVHYLDLYGKKKFETSLGKIEGYLELGTGVGQKTHRQDFIISRLSHENFTAEGGFFSARGLIGTKWMDFDNTGIYGWIAVHPEHGYLALGNNTNVTYGFAGIKGFKDFGEFAFAKYDRRTGDYWIKSQTGFGDVNQGFYSTEMFNIASNYFCLDQFNPMHLGPVSTKADIALKVEAKGNEHGAKAFEVVAANRNDILQFGIGINTQYGHDTEKKSGLIIEAFKPINIGDFKGAIEARYDGLNKKTHLYVIANYGF